MRMTKIICTLGPATDDPAVLEAMIRSGMNVARFNFSHGSHEDHKVRYDQLRAVSEKVGEPVAAMLDTKGPDVRIGSFQNGKILLKEGDAFTLSAKPCDGDQSKVFVNYEKLPDKVGPGNAILLNDGLIELKVTDVEGGQIHCRVITGGELSNHKSLHVPGIHLDIPYMSEQDEKDILFAIENDFEYIAASYVRNAGDVMEIKKVLDKNGGKNIQIISKIENAEGVENLEEILRISDGLMVARGDMGVEIPFEEIPRLQKVIIRMVAAAGKKSITATQMLESMIANPRPTRAEITDVANAIYDGTSAIMLSGETAIGKYPAEAVRTMVRIALSTEADIDYKGRFNRMKSAAFPNVTEAISRATCTVAHELNAAAIVTVTKSGTTARMISKYRPACPIVGCSPDSKVVRQLALSWGVHPMLAREMEDSDDLLEHAVELAVESGLVHTGDQVVITAGIPIGIDGTTNLVKVHTVGHVLVSGIGVNPISTVGTTCVCKTEEEALLKFNAGDILVIPETSNKLLSILKKAKAIITESGTINTHAAIVGQTLDIPVIVGAPHATDIIRHGSTVTVDAQRGTVYSGVAKV